ncbi:MAG: [FeFe] hydrogenase H-cluster radical SAM maturase HydE [Acidobacteria bacterium]|nr:MAG: [FeFe] hydrogenase H-cluster radical SAM maturase HydE [Acidobacteriota bacterium]
MGTSAPSRQNLIQMLAAEGTDARRELYQQAYRIKLEQVGKLVYFRGIIEFSNICTKNCYYCGIRRENTTTKRFSMSADEILECAKLAHDYNYGSIVLQAGERNDPEFVDFVETIVRNIKTMSDGGLGITLSLGEQSSDTYQRWFESGAHRYLIRIETSNRGLYSSLHPEDHDFDRRLSCIRELRDIGYQVGTGVMVGLPGQTIEDLADDILFFKKIDADMIGMGPYIIHHDTPLAVNASDFDPARQLRLGLNMIAATRIALEDVNIAATTALQALDPKGRELGLQAGANIIMPNITHTRYRSSYQLYDNKPCLDENAGLCRACLSHRITGIGEEIGYNQWGDSPHFFKRNQLDK